MIILFIILSIFFLISLFFVLFVLSALEIEIDNFYLDTTRKKKIKTCLINISLKLFNKITWIKIKVSDKKVRDLEINKYKDFYIEILKNIKRFDIKLKKFKMYLNIGTEDVVFTSAITAFLSSFIGILIANTIDKFESKNYQYTITPYYNNTNFLKLKLNCIINVKMVHIINIIYIILQKRSDVKNARTSNTRSYDYSHE